LIKIEPLHGILLLKQIAQRTEKEYAGYKILKNNIKVNPTK
jgi:uncharacterized protein (DUF2132 family)